MRVRLEEQLAKLAKMGLPLDKGITIKHVLEWLDRDHYERHPYEDIVTRLAGETKKRVRLCSRVWAFDAECIHGPKSYANIVERLAGVADRKVAGVKSGHGSVDFKLGGKLHKFGFEINEDWADMLQLRKVMKVLEHKDRKFYAIPGGQMMTLFCLTAANADKLRGFGHGLDRVTRA